MKQFFRKNIFFIAALLALFLFYWFRYRVAPNIEFAETRAMDQKGNALFLGDELKQPTILHFYASWCGPCMSEIRTLNTRIALLESQGIKVLFVTDDPASQIAKMSATLPASVSIYKVEKLKDLGIHTIPTTYFINSAGETKKKIVDVCNWENDDFCTEIISIIQN